jgi:hypothetical protein
MSTKTKQNRNPFNQNAGKQPKLTCSRINRAFNYDNGGLLNMVLYDLCKKHPTHKSKEEIRAKIILIGRSYAAAIERRKIKRGRNSGDRFFTNIVVPEIRKSDIDKWLKSLSELRRPTPSNAEKILAVHGKVLNLFYKITKMEKRSLASKYLHFHYPRLFFLYDSRAVRSIRDLTAPLGRASNLNNNIDKEYGRFYMRCLGLQRYIKTECGVYMNPRQIDNLLLLRG